MAWGLSYLQDTLWLQKEMMGSKPMGAKDLSAVGSMTFGPQSCKDQVSSGFLEEEAHALGETPVVNVFIGGGRG